MGKIAVLGTGPSIIFYKAEEPYIFDATIGVNDIWKYVKTDAVVCLDKPNVFTQERLKIINECTPKVFFSQIVLWDRRNDFSKIDLQAGYPDRICDIESRLIPKSYCSPFVASVIAYKYYNAREIHLFGVDLKNHPHLNGQLCQRIRIHFKNLKYALASKGVAFIVHGDGILTEL
jgi:hypothetical protein